MTEKEIISDIELRLFAGKPTDDSEIDARQISFELNVVRLALLKDYYDKNKEIPSSALKRYDCLCVKTEQPVCLEGTCYSRSYIEMPATPVQFPNDIGIYNLVWQAGMKNVERYQAGMTNIFKHTRFGAPSEKNPKFYVLGNKIYMAGSCFAKCKFYVDMVPADLSEFGEDDKYPLPDELISPLIEAVTQSLARELGGIYDIENDSKQY